MSGIASRLIRLLLVCAICLLLAPSLAAAPPQRLRRLLTTRANGVLPSEPAAAVETADDAVRQKIQPALRTQAAALPANGALAVLVIAQPVTRFQPLRPRHR